MKAVLWMACLLGLALPAPARASEALDVVASFSVLADIARAIGGPAVRVHAIVGPDTDAHVYQPRPSDLKRVADADVVICHGLGFDPWMARLVAAAGYRGPTVTAARTVVPLRSGNSVDPHAWQDPRNASRYVDEIVAVLMRARPQHAAAVQARAAEYRQALQELHEDYVRALTDLAPERRRFVTSHDAFGYLASAYGLQVIAPQGWSTDAAPKARAVAGIIGQLRQHQVQAVFFENVVDRRLIDRIALEGGASIGARLYSDALAAPSHPADTYLGMMRHNLFQLERALRARSPGEMP